MKVKLKATIMEVAKRTTFSGSGNVDVTNMVRLKIIANHGKVETTLNNAQLAALDGNLFLREVIANQVKIGATLTITISDEEADEGTV